MTDSKHEKTSNQGYSKAPGQKRRILQLSPFFDNSCGVGTVAKSLTDDLRSKGHKVDTLEYQPWKQRGQYKLTRRGDTFQFSSSEKLMQFIKENHLKYDVLHFHNQVFANGRNENLFRHFKDTPKITQIHCVVPYDNEVLGKKSLHNYEELSRQERMLQKSDRVVHLTQEVKDIAMKHYGVEHPNDTVVIHNAAKRPTIDPSKVDELKRRLAPNNEKLFLYAGRLSEEKGIVELAEGFSKAKEKHPDIKLVICGENKTNPQIKEEIAKRLGNLREGKDFTFEGKVSQEKLSDYYAACDFFIQPSRYEHFSVSAIEAMSHNKPIIMTKMDSIKDTFKLDSKDKVAIPIEKIDSPESIEKAIDSSMKIGKKDLDSMVERAKRFYEGSLTPDKITSSFEKQYEDLIKTKKPTKPSRHVYIVPTSEGGYALRKTIDSVISKADDDSKIIVSGYDGFKPTDEFMKAYQGPIRHGKIEVMASEKKITKTKSSALNKAVGEAAKHGAEYATLVLPGDEPQDVKKAIDDFKHGTYLVHSSDGDDSDLRRKLEKGENPIHQSKTTYKMGVFDKVGLFYDSMPYAEDMDFYTKMMNNMSRKAIRKYKVYHQ